jgi:pilus assembly protein CpaB
MPRQKIILIIGVALALVAVVMVKVYLDQQRRLAQEMAKRTLEKSQVNQTTLLVATVDIPQGAAVEQNSVDKKTVPNQFVQPGAVTSFDRISGMLAIAPISKGEQITLSKLSYQRTGENLASVTPAGKRAISIPVDSIASVGGMVKPGDYVDLIAMLNVPITTADGKQMVQNAVLPLFQNVLVLAVGQEISSLATAQGRYRKTTEVSPLITLALSPQEANLVAFVQEQGKIRLVLRSPTDTKVEPMQPASWDTLFQYLMPPPQQAEEPKPEPAAGYVEIYRGLNKEKVPLTK